MKITIGTDNPIKVSALTEVLMEYSSLKFAEVIYDKVHSGISDQPLTLDETMQGAENRARRAYTDGCAFSVGIESGFLEAPRTKGGLMEVTICAIYDGNDVHYGFSPCFNCPADIMQYLQQGYDLNNAAHLAGYTTNQEVGKAEGIVGILTRGRVTRKEYTKQALRMALIHVEQRLLGER